MSLGEGLVSAERFRAMVERRAGVIQKHMSPPGKLKGVTGKLEERRFRYGIPDEAFKVQATFKRVFVKQIEEWEGETFGPDSRLVRTDVQKQRGRESTPRGVLVSAGLEAQDVLLSHGIELGDIVWIVQMSIFRLPVLSIDGTDEVLLVLNVGDVNGCEDAWERLQSGEMVSEYDEKAKQHHYTWKGKELPRPISPWINSEF